MSSSPWKSCRVFIWWTWKYMHINCKREGKKRREKNQKNQFLVNVPLLCRMSSPSLYDLHSRKKNCQFPNIFFYANNTREMNGKMCVGTCKAEAPKKKISYKLYEIFRKLIESTKSRIEYAQWEETRFLSFFFNSFDFSSVKRIKWKD